MTNEEKARAYDEALERAKKYNIDDAYACQGTVVKLIFPQLAESEDERVRKFLVDFFASYKIGDAETKLNGVRIDDILAYLEKQEKEADERLERVEQFRKEVQELGEEIASLRKKIYGDERIEQKPIKWTDLTWKDIVELEGIINNVHYEFRNGIGQESFGKEVLERFRESKGDDYVDEQKSAEYLKAERDGWYVCIKDYYRGGKKQSSVGDLVQAKGGMHIMGEEDISEWFRRAYYEEVRDAFEPNTDTNIPEKYTEWSEEDKNKIERLAFLVSVVEEKEMISPSESIDLRNFIKSLRPQSKQNDVITPNKEFFQWIYDRLVNVHNEDPNVDYMISFKKRIEESSWKPSEEQMEVDLEKEIEKYFKGWTETDEGIACHYQYVDLNTCHGIAHHFYELGQQEMRHRIMNPEYNAKVVERLKSEYPIIKEK